MLKINTVTMKEEIEDVLMNSYDKFGNFDEPKATKELLNLFNVSVSFLYEFVNEFTDTEIPKEAIQETLDKLNER